MSKSKYCLYIGKIQNIPEEAKYTYYNSDNQYILLFMDKKPKIGDFRLVPAKLHKDLTTEEKKWLTSIKLLINAEYIRQNSDKFGKVLEQFADELEKQLKIEKEKADKAKNEQQENF